MPPRFLDGCESSAGEIKLDRLAELHDHFPWAKTPHAVQVTSSVRMIVGSPFAVSMLIRTLLNTARTVLERGKDVQHESAIATYATMLCIALREKIPRDGPSDISSSVKRVVDGLQALVPLLAWDR